MARRTELRERLARSGGPDVTDRFGAECEALVCGRYREWAEAAGLPAPPWAAVNLIAHGTVDEVLDHLAGQPVPVRAHTWAEAAVLVEHIVLSAVSYDDLASVQRHILIPLELRLMRATPSPGALVDRVIDAVL